MVSVMIRCCYDVGVVRLKSKVFDDKVMFLFALLKKNIEMEVVI